MKCSAIGNPIPTIFWFVDGNLLSPSGAIPSEHDQGGRLWPESNNNNNHHYSSASFIQMNEIISHVNISSIRVQDSGEWKCIASNLLSSTSHSARLNIYGELKPLFHIYLNHFANQFLLLFCGCTRILVHFPVFCICSIGVLNCTIVLNVTASKFYSSEEKYRI